MSGSAQVFAKQLGIANRANTDRLSMLSWDNVLDLAVTAYWERRKTSAAVAVADGEARPAAAAGDAA